MDLLTLCTCCFFSTVIIFIVAMILGQKRMRQVEVVMRQLAERHSAQFTPGTLIFNPYITFEDRGLSLRLISALGGRDDPSHTELLVSLPFEKVSAVLSPQSRLRLRTHNFATRLTITLGAKPILTGDQAFDSAFDLRGAPDVLVKRAITPEIRHQLVSLKENRPSVRLYRHRSLLPIRTRNGEPALLHWEPVTLQYSFCTGGLPADVADWEPRLQTGRQLLNNILGRNTMDESVQESSPINDHHDILE